MGIYDRDYYRREGPSFLRQLSVRGRVCKWLIVVNVAVFVVQLFTIQRNELGGRAGEGPVYDLFALQPGKVVDGLELWRLLTHAFLHSTRNPLHIVLNLLVLWWAGSEMEEMYGPKEFLAFYLVGALVSGVVFTATMLGEPVRAVGASGAITALMVLFACHFPNRTVLFMFVIPMPIWLLVVAYTGYEFVQWVTKADTEIAITGHLGGAAFGFFYYKLHWRLTGWLGGWSAWRRRRARPPLRVYREEPEDTPTPVGVAAKAADMDEHLEAKLDAVLEKMSLVGKDNLTDEEKQVLQQASEFYRRRRT
jgi:membrane associated rhomboid family serine protease